MKDGQVIETMGTKKYRHYRKKKRLLIRDPNEMDSGVYECALAPNSTEKGKAELWSKLTACVLTSMASGHLSTLATATRTTTYA